LKAWLFATCAIAGFGCTSDPKTQLLTGKLSTTNAIAVRAVDGTTIVTAARVRTDGSFTLQLPAGHHYRLEVLTATGVHNIVATKNGQLWMATDRGIAAWDGQKVRRVDMRRGLAENNILDIAADQFDRIWARGAGSLTLISQ